MKQILKLSVVNFNAHWGDKEHNLAAILDYIELAAAAGSGTILFPEMALTGYSDEADTPKSDKMQTRLAETIPGPATEKVSVLTKRLGIYAVFGMPERDRQDPSLVYNSAAVCGPEGIVGSYRKIHPYGAENSWAERGDAPLLFDTPWGPVGVGICCDTYEFPELMHYYRAKGARLYLNPTALLNPFAKAPNCRAIVEAEVVQSCIYIASSDLCGPDGPNNMWGGSHVVGPNETGQGAHYYCGSPFFTQEGHQVGMHTGVIDLSYADTCMDFHPLFKRNPLVTHKPFGPDFRPDVYIKLYQDLLRDPRWLSLYDEEVRPKPLD